MTTREGFFLMGAIYVAPHVTREVGIALAIAFLLLGGVALFWDVKK